MRTLVHINIVKGFLSGARSSYEEKQRSILISLIFGLFGLLPAIAIVILSNSLTVFADLLKNVGLVAAIFVSWLAVRRTRRGKTASYNYGYGKLENLSSLALAAVMVISFAIILWELIQRFQHPESLHAEGAWIGVVLAGVAIISNGYLWRHGRHIAKRHTSPLMESLWRLERAKTTANSIVFSSLALSLAFSGYSWVVYIDPVGSIAMLGFLSFSIYGILSMSVYDLLDKTLEESLQLVILRELVAYFEDYVAIHGVKSRRSGGNVFIEILLEFDGEQKMSEVQNIIDNMRTGLEQKIPGSQVVIAPVTSAII